MKFLMFFIIKKQKSETEFENLHLTTLSLLHAIFDNLKAGNTKGGSITVPLTSCLTGLESAV